MNETELDNLLVEQKNQILDLIVRKAELEAALQILRVLAPLWKASSYEYKTKELIQRICQDASCLESSSYPKASERGTQLLKYIQENFQW